MPTVHRPNVLLCLFDSLSCADSGLVSSEHSLPSLSGLRDKSTFFSNVYAPCPESSPARASLFTGLDPCVHGLWTNGVALPATEHSVATHLLKAGYTTWLAGRRQLAGMSQWTTEFIRAGEYTELDWAHGPLHRSRQNAYLGWLQHQSPEHYQRLFDRQADPAATRLQTRQRTALVELPDNLSFNYWVGERIVQRIDEHDASQPFFAVAGFSVGSSFGAQPAHSHDGELVHQPALIQADAALGSLLNCLSANKLSEDTIVLVTAARGNWKADTTQTAHTATHSRHTDASHTIDATDATDATNTAENVVAASGNLLNERAIRVPLILHRPGQGHTVIDTPMSTMDIAPTIIHAAGLGTTTRMQGHSLFNETGKPVAPQGWVMSRVRRNVNESDKRYWQSALRLEQMKLVVTHANPHTNTPASYQLFDLHDDPHELTDLAHQPAHADTLENMIDCMIDARCALEDRTEPRIAKF